MRPAKFAVVGDGVIWRPQAEKTPSPSTKTPKTTRRTIAASSLLPWIVAAGGAVAMALAFPKTNVAVLAPLGAVGLFWAWFGASPRRAFLLGLAAGTIFFSIAYSWFGETAGALIAPFGFVLTLGPAVGDAFFGFALVGVAVSYAVRLAPRNVAPLAAAAAFAFGEWLRSEGLGPLGVPFASLGYTQVTTPLAPLAALAGSYGVTFALCVPAAYVAYALRERGARPAVRAAALACFAVVAATAFAWFVWRAPHAPKPAYRVVAVQGNIRQSVKWTRAAFEEALLRYETLTASARARRPQLVVWPETVITAALNEQPWLQLRFARLARSLHAELAVGTLQRIRGVEFNVLYFFRPDGALDTVYRKRQLVPFAEHLPFAPLFAWIPWTSEISHFGTGETSGVVDAGGLHFGPIICWESAFAGLVVGDVRDGADALIVATDDAWFGTTAGPYQHAQITQMRALETGRWVVRAASTGVSGIVSPTGRFTQHSDLDTQTLVAGEIGSPVDTAFDAIGPAGIALALAFVYGVVLLVPTMRRRIRA